VQGEKAYIVSSVLFYRKATYRKATFLKKIRFMRTIRNNFKPMREVKE